jgi:23S rRNA pseudouridine1911/1915/1917 synthase
MPFKKKRKPHIPPGAPGHPRTGAEPRPAQAPRSTTRERKYPAPKPARAAPARTSARLVYEDEAILGYDKPVGLPVIAPDGSRTRCLLDVATERVARHNSKGRAAVVHRIDRDTSGVVIFAVDGRTKKLLMDSWDELVTQRLYVALVEGSMAEGSGVFDSWLRENKAGEVYGAEPNEKGAKRAVTRWRVLRQGGGLCLLELALETGRKHQIRVQLADSGHPVVGDERYGSTRTGASGRAIDAGRLCLHARLIELKLPGRDALRIESPPPPEFDALLSAAVKAAATAAATEAKAPLRRVGGRNGVASSSRSGERSATRPRRDHPRGK